MEEDAKRFRWLCENIKEVIHQSPSEYTPLKTKYELPLLIAYADFCGPISFTEAIDIARNKND